MDKKRIEEFATTARKQLIQNLTYEASRIGITPTEIQEPTTDAEDMQIFTTGTVTNTLYKKQIEQRNQLINEIQTHTFDEVIEKIAYTWFNRIIAIRFMEINNYLPTHTRVLSSITPGKKEPDIITEALNLDLDYTEEEIQQIYKYKTENQTDELFKLLFIKQCNKLNEILPELFETIDDYTEILFNIQLSNENNIINKLIEKIPEEYFTDQVEIIGWLYQYYNKELKDQTFANLKKRIKISKDRIPAATQLFTPDWIVKYMVENSVGRLWLENHPNNDLKSKWKYYIEDANQEHEVELQLIKIKKESEILKPEDIKIIDPCMGSGHILVYVFDVLMQIYLSEGYVEQEATELILKNNIYGLDIDKRAYQLSYFAVLMKARKYNRKILTKKLSPALLSIEESNRISKLFINTLTSFNNNITDDLNYIINSFKDAKEYGSILKIYSIDYKEIINTINSWKSSKSNLKIFKYSNDIDALKNIIHQAELITGKYDIVITNPPYLGKTGLNDNLRNYLKNNYPDSKTDLFAVFIEKCEDMLKDYGYSSMITQQTFMFLSTYENLRKKFLKNTLINMIHLGPKAFAEISGEVVQSTSFVIKKMNLKNYNSTFIRLVDFDSKNKEVEFFNKNNKTCCSLNNISHIPGSPIVYGINENIIKAFKNSKKIIDCADVKSGLSTGDNNIFLRYWFEIDYNSIGFKVNQENKNENTLYKWIPYNKGGLFRKWYGNQDYVVNWENNGSEIKNFEKSVIRNENFYFKKSLTWSRISSSNFGVRFSPEGFIFDVNSPSLFINDDNYFYLGGLLCSNISTLILSILNPTLTFQVGNINLLPIVFSEDEKKIINNLVKENIEISKNDWFDYETSWGFLKHPLLETNKYLSDNYNNWSNYKENQFNILLSNETELNKKFSKIYDVPLDCDIDDKNITLNKADYQSDIKSFISYAIGCMFGRYSLDKKGLVFAGGDFNIKQYCTVIPDEDNIIPVLDDEYFDDDIVNQIVNFIKVTFGEETLEINLDFIAKYLDSTGKSSREIIRNYMIKKFYSNHVRMYQKCPIYWMFDSGKQNAFKCLIYMHRYEPNLVSRIRFDYLHKTQRAIEDNIKLQESIINDSENKSRVNKANKKKTKLIKQLDEIKLYDLALAHVANQRIEIDLDDGVKVNYAKFQNVEVVDPNTNKTRKINLLKKI